MAKVMGGKPFGGIPIGILLLNARYALIPGNVGNATSYDFPIRYKTVDLPPRWWFELNEEKYQIFIKAAKELETEGVKAITSGCGLFVTWQERAAKDLNIPIFTSPMLMIPMVSRIIGTNKKVGVITAAGERLYEQNFLEASGVDSSIPIVVGGIDTCSEFLECIRYQTKEEMDTDVFEQQVVGVAQKMLEEEPQIGAFVFECSDIPPFAKAVAEATRLPVFDFISLIHLVYRALYPVEYKGFV